MFVQFTEACCSSCLPSCNPLSISCLQGDAPVILGGDLNCGPQDIEVVMLRSLLPQLQDSWHTLHPDEPGNTSNYDLPGQQCALSCP